MPGRFKRINARGKPAAKETELRMYTGSLDKQMDYDSSCKITLLVNESIHKVNVIAICKI